MGLRRSFKPTNLVQNGDFSKGTAGWSNGGTGTISASNNICTHIGNGAILTNQLVTSISNISVSGEKIYCRAKMKVTNTDCTKINLTIRDSSNPYTDVVYQNTPVQNQVYLLSGIKTIPAGASGNNSIAVNSNYSSAAIAKDKVMEIQEVTAINLTALFGAGNEPDKAWCDLNIPAWFDGTLGNGVIGSIGGLK